MTFELTSTPAPTVTWLLNSKPVTSGGRITTNMIEKSGIYTISMEISQVTSADQGDYKAVANNPHGQASASLMLNAGSGKGIHTCCSRTLSNFNKIKKTKVVCKILFP